MASNQWTHKAEWNTLRETAAADISSNYSKLGTLVGADAVEAGTTDTIITATAHAAVVGDEIIMTSGDEAEEAREVTAVDTNTITLESALSGTPTATETFDIIRPVAISQNGGKLLLGNNRLNGPVYLSFDGTTDHLYWFNSTTITLDLKASGLHAERGGYIYCRHAGSAPASGSLYVSEVA